MQKSHKWHFYLLNPKKCSNFAVDSTSPKGWEGQDIWILYSIVPFTADIVSVRIALLSVRKDVF